LLAFLFCRTIYYGQLGSIINENQNSIKSTKSLEEQKRGKSHIYQVHCKIKLRKDADRELLKTDIRAIKGVTIVTTVPQSEKTTESFSYQVIKIKFQPYDTPPATFVKNLSDSFRKLTKRGWLHSILIQKV
jgi:hypothetical protein